MELKNTRICRQVAFLLFPLPHGMVPAISPEFSQ
jgi:hypothetical protein